MAALSGVEHRNKLKKSTVEIKKWEPEEEISEAEVNLEFGHVSVL